MLVTRTSLAPDARRASCDALGAQLVGGITDHPNELIAERHLAARRDPGHLLPRVPDLVPADLPTADRVHGRCVRRRATRRPPSVRRRRSPRCSAPHRTARPRRGPRPLRTSSSPPFFPDAASLYRHRPDSLRSWVRRCSSKGRSSTGRPARRCGHAGGVSDARPLHEFAQGPSPGSGAQEEGRLSAVLACTPGDVARHGLA